MQDVARTFSHDVTLIYLLILNIFDGFNNEQSRLINLTIKHPLHKSFTDLCVFWKIQRNQWKKGTQAYKLESHAWLVSINHLIIESLENSEEYQVRASPLSTRCRLQFNNRHGESRSPHHCFSYHIPHSVHVRSPSRFRVTV